MHVADMKLQNNKVSLTFLKEHFGTEGSKDLRL